MILEIIALMILIYSLSAFGMYHYIRIYYSKGGIDECHQIDKYDLLIVFVPAINTILLVIGWLIFFPYRDLNKFFKIKK